jgi:hypothetical protein
VVDVASGLPLRKQVALTARIENLFNAKRIAAISGDGTEERSSPRTIWIGLRISPHGV